MGCHSLHAPTMAWLLAWLLASLLAGCASAPQPVMPDGKGRKPVNSAAAIRAYHDSLRDGRLPTAHASELPRSPQGIAGGLTHGNKHGSTHRSTSPGTRKDPSAPPAAKPASIPSKAKPSGAATLEGDRRAIPIPAGRPGMERPAAPRAVIRKGSAPQRNGPAQSASHAFVPALR